jgi:glutamyl/glutaminyl-tRNA synthetase
MRFDDTNPEKEEQEYVDSITEMVQWLGFGWDPAFGENHLFYASNYFDFMYRAAEALISEQKHMLMNKPPMKCGLTRHSNGGWKRFTLPHAGQSMKT